MAAQDDELPRTQIETESIAELVYQALRRDIAHGIYKPGLLRIRMLTERFGVSATPVREALRRLESEGLVTLRNRRIMVRSLSENELHEIFALRSELEAFAISRAAPAVKDDQPRLARLEELIAGMDEFDTDPESWRQANQEFHMLIYEANGMERLTAMIDSLWVAVEPYLRLYVHTAPRLDQAQTEHKQMLKALRRGESEKASELLRKHLAGTETIVQRGISEEE